MTLIRQPVYDLGQRPFMVIWETTQACDLACKHCRAEAQPGHHPEALSFEEGKQLIDQVVDMGMPHPLFILTGGDPFKREDIFDLTAYAAQQGLPVALSPSGTPLLNPRNLGWLKEAGCKVISLSLDGSTAEIHDSFRGVAGSYDWTVNGWMKAREIGLNKRVVLQRAYLEAHHLPVEPYMRLNDTYWRLMEQMRAHIGFSSLEMAVEPERMRRTPMHVNAGDGFVFVSLLGDVFPSGYLPLKAGNVRSQPLKDIYQQSELFRSLRNKDALHGRCGQCEYRFVCGGSRSRAFAVTGDYLAEEPFCAYQPGAFPFADAIPENRR